MKLCKNIKHHQHQRQTHIQKCTKLPQKFNIRRIKLQWHTEILGDKTAYFSTEFIICAKALLCSCVLQFLLKKPCEHIFPGSCLTFVCSYNFRFFVCICFCRHFSRLGTAYYHIHLLNEILNLCVQSWFCMYVQWTLSLFPQDEKIMLSFTLHWRITDQLSV